MATEERFSSALADLPTSATHDYLLYNGTIYTMSEPCEPEDPFPPCLRVFGWMFVKDGVVHGVGSGPRPPGKVGKETTQIDLGGRVVVPGLWDAHCHVFAQACLANVVSLAACPSVEDMVARLQKKAGSINPEKTPKVEGVQWDQAEMGRLPTRQDLDRIEFPGGAEVPIFCSRRCWHISVVNTAALKVCGLMDVPASELMDGVDVDQNGVPTGIVREGASNFVADKLNSNELPFAEKTSLTDRALRMFAARGVTSIQSNDGQAIGGISDPWDVYKHLIAPTAGGAPLYPRVFLTCESSNEKISQDYRGSVDDATWARLSCERCKIFMDGGLGASTAALTEPYADTDPDFTPSAEVPHNPNRGMITCCDDTLDRVFKVSYAHGMRIEAHAIGDAAFEKIIDALDAREDWHPRLTVTHCQILNPSLMERLSAKYRDGKIVASVQPQFTASDMPVVHSKLGEMRVGNSYVWRTMMDKLGMTVMGGSDAPVETVSPLRALAAALRNPLHATENMAPLEALAMFTVHAAYAMKREDDLGRLCPGFRADFVVLESTAATFWERDIHETTFQLAGVARTVIDGACVYNKRTDGALALDPERPPDTLAPGRCGRRALYKCKCCKKGFVPHARPAPAGVDSSTL